MAKQVDARDLKSLDRKVMPVRSRLRAPSKSSSYTSPLNEPLPLRFPEASQGSPRLKSFPHAQHDVGMPRRVAAVSTEFLTREVDHLDDSVLLLPQQVFILTGLSLGMLKERMRTRPPHRSAEREKVGSTGTSSPCGDEKPGTTWTRACPCAHRSRSHPCPQLGANPSRGGIIPG